MRIGLVLALSTALALSGACKREHAPDAPTASTASPPAAKPAPAKPPAPTRDAVFGKPQLDQMLAPIALYPDALLAQVLMAATYPGDVADAVAWSRAHPGAKGEQAVRQVAGQPWDPSVQTLVAFPQALALLGQDHAWVQRLGDAFLAQPEAVMDSIQRLRRKAHQTGHLESNQYQNVRAGPQPARASQAPPEEGSHAAVPDDYAQAYYIEPVDEELVYVPSYDPMEVYGTWDDPYYLPEYYPPPAGYYLRDALAAGVAFGIGVAIIDSLWGDLDWNDGGIDIDIDRFNRVHVEQPIAGGDRTWRHDPVNRDGVPYRDRISREQYGRHLEGAQARDAFRGDDAQRMASREQARAAMQQRGVHTPATDHRRALEDARAAELEEANARDRAMAVQQQRDRELDQSRRAQLGEQPVRDGPGDAGIVDRAPGADREAALGEERARAAARDLQAANARRELQAADQLRARRAAEEHRARQNAFAGVREAQAAQQMAIDRGRASMAPRPSAPRGGGRRR